MNYKLNCDKSITLIILSIIIPKSYKLLRLKVLFNIILLNIKLIFINDKSFPLLHKTNNFPVFN